MNHCVLAGHPDHESLARLARDDPNAYEALRSRLVNELIDGAPEAMQRRLRGLQFRIDQLRRLARTPLGATVKIYSLMWGSFLTLNRELSGFHSYRPHPEQSARIIEFRPRKGGSTAAPKFESEGER